jgi:hypothetical protein
MALTELAEKYDSRMKAAREAERNKKGAAKKKREAAAKAAKDAEEAALVKKREEEEEAAKAAEIAKKAKMNEKDVIKKLRKSLRDLIKKCALGVNTDQFQELVVEMKAAADLEAFTKRCEDAAGMAADNAEPANISALVSVVAEKIKEVLKVELIPGDIDLNRNAYLQEMEKKKNQQAAAEASNKAAQNEVNNNKSTAANVGTSDQGAGGKKGKKNNKKKGKGGIL